MQGIPGPPGIDAEEAEFPYIIPGPVGPPGLVGGNYAQFLQQASVTPSLGNRMLGLMSGTNFFTPVSTGVVFGIVTLRANIPASATVIFSLFYGTGNGPALNDAFTGTLIGLATGNIATGQYIITLPIQIQGLTLGTSIWIDVGVNTTFSASSFEDFNISVWEYAGAGFAEFLGGVPGIDAEEPEYQYIIPGPKGDTGPAGGAASDISMNKLNPAGDITITPGYAAYISDYYEITLSKFLEVGLGSVFEVG
jgi:hypothetical protein